MTLPATNTFRREPSRMTRRALPAVVPLAVVHAAGFLAFALLAQDLRGTGGGTVAVEQWVRSLSIGCLVAVAAALSLAVWGTSARVDVDGPRLVRALRFLGLVGALAAVVIALIAHQALRDHAASTSALQLLALAVAGLATTLTLTAVLGTTRRPRPDAPPADRDDAAR